MKEFEGGTFGLPCALDPALPRPRARGTTSCSSTRSCASTASFRDARSPGVDRGALRDPVGERRRKPRSPTSSRRGCAASAAPLRGRAHRRERRRPHRARARARASCSAATSTPCPRTATQTPRRDGDVLHGLGTADMKGGLAVMLALADDLAPARGPFRRHARVLRGRGGRRRAQRAAAAVRRAPELVQGDLAILLEPTGGWVEAGCQGTIHVQRDLRRRARRTRPGRGWA